MLCEQLFLTKEAKKIPTVFLSGVKYKIKSIFNFSYLAGKDMHLKA